MDETTLLTLPSLESAWTTLRPIGRPILVWASWARRQNACPTTDQVAHLMIAVLESVRGHGVPVPMEAVWASPNGSIEIVFPNLQPGNPRFALHRCLKGLAHLACEMIASVSFPEDAPPAQTLARTRYAAKIRAIDLDPALTYCLERLFGLGCLGAYDSISDALIDLKELYPQEPGTSRFGLATFQRHPRMTQVPLAPPVMHTISSFRTVALAAGSSAAICLVALTAFSLGRLSTSPTPKEIAVQAAPLPKPTPIPVPESQLVEASSPAVLETRRDPLPTSKRSLGSEPKTVEKPHSSLIRPSQMARISNESVQDTGADEPLFVDGPAPAVANTTHSAHREASTFVARVERKR